MSGQATDLTASDLANLSDEGVHDEPAIEQFDEEGYLSDLNAEFALGATDNAPEASPGNQGTPPPNPHQATEPKGAAPAAPVGDLPPLPTAEEIQALEIDLGKPATALLSSLLKGLQARDAMIAELSGIRGVKDHLGTLDQIKKMSPLLNGVADVAVRENRRQYREIMTGLNTIAAMGAASLVGKTEKDRKENPAIIKNIDRVLQRAYRARQLAEARGDDSRPMNKIIVDVWKAMNNKSVAPEDAQEPALAAAAAAQARRSNPGSTTGGGRGAAPVGASGKQVAQSRISQWLRSSQ